MFARIGAKVVFAMIGMALIFFGVGLLGLAIATALAPRVGAAGGYAIAGGIFAGPPLLWALIVSMRGPRRDKPITGKGEMMASIFSALARETPWAAVVGASLVGIANLFLNRHKNKK